MRAKQLETLLSDFSPFGPSELDMRSRRLRESGLLPNTGRGRGSPDLTPQHAANIIIGLGASERADLAGAAVILYSALKPSSGDKWGFAGYQTVGELVTEILEDWENKLGIETLSICRSWPMVTLSLTDKPDFRYGYDQAADAEKDGFKTYPIRQEMVFNAGVLTQIALELEPQSEEEAGGFVGEGGMAKKLEEIRAAQEKARKGPK